MNDRFHVLRRALRARSCWRLKLRALPAQAAAIHRLTYKCRPSAPGPAYAIKRTSGFSFTVLKTAILETTYFRPFAEVCAWTGSRHHLSARLFLYCETEVGQPFYSLAAGFCIRRMPAARISPISVSLSSAVMVLGSGCPCPHRARGCGWG